MLLASSSRAMHICCYGWERLGSISHFMAVSIVIAFKGPSTLGHHLAHHDSGHMTPVPSQNGANQ